MATDVSEVIGTAIGKAAREGIRGVSKSARKRSRQSLPAPKGLAAGAAGLGLVALAPLLGKGISSAASGAVDKGTANLKGAGNKVGDRVGEQIKGKVKDDVKDAIPGSGLFSKTSKGGGVPGVGKGRRMPIQQDFDIGVPVRTVYDQWTQFEEWPKFMHRVTEVSQEDDTHVKFKAKIWGKTKEFTAEICEQRPDERIKWRVTEGMTHTGVVSFHELGPRLTRVELNLDIDPGSLIEKAARGMRHIKRAVRADVARFKAYVLMEEEETGAWRGEVEDAEVKKKSSSGRGRSASKSSSGRSSSSRSSQNGARSSSRSSSGRSSSGRSSSGRSSSGRSSSGRSSSGRSSSKRARGAKNGSGNSSSNRGRASSSSRRRSGSHS